MKDSEIREMVLRKFYEKRKEHGTYSPRPEDFNGIDERDLLRAGDQLGEEGLIKWIKWAPEGVTLRGEGRINSAGVRAIEDGKQHAQNFATPQLISINNSSNFQLGNHNTQSIVQVFNDIVEKIDDSSASAEAKAEAKSRLTKFLTHPLVVAALGPVVDAIIASIK